MILTAKICSMEQKERENEKQENNDLLSQLLNAINELGIG
jgi:tartrate dehydratase alpha subunit/fumarate hydratase class I-like protein